MSVTKLYLHCLNHTVLFSESSFFPISTFFVIVHSADKDMIGGPDSLLTVFHTKDLIFSTLKMEVISPYEISKRVTHRDSISFSP